jgi:hypothetical protein
VSNEQLDRLCGKWTLAELLAEVEREVQQREKVYPRLVERRTMSARSAEEQTGKMRRVAAILTALAETNPRAAGLLL